MAALASCNNVSSQMYCMRPWALPNLWTQPGPSQTVDHEKGSIKEVVTTVIPSPHICYKAIGNQIRTQ